MYDPLNDGLSVLEYVEETTLAYLAGFFDGEGCITCNGTSNLPYAKISHTYYPALQEFQYYFGGTIRDFNDKTNVKPSWVWVVCGDNAKTLLSALLPHLREKKQQAKIALKLLDTRLVKGTKRTPEVLVLREGLKKELAQCKR